MLADFGLAKLLPTEQDPHITARVTRTGDFIGTPSYMSPEQAQNPALVTVASDVYSLGATLYALLTGGPPFRGGTPVETLRQVCEDAPVPPRKRQPSVPRDLETICLKCLEKDPKKRYESADELAGRLRLFLENRPIPDRPVSRTEKLWRWCRRNPLLAALDAAVLGLFLVIAIGAPIAVWLLNAERESAVNAERDALGQRKQVQRKAAQTLFEQALSQCEEEGAPRGMVSLARCLEEASNAEAPDLENAIRLQLAAWGRSLQPLKPMLLPASFPPPGRLSGGIAAAFSPNRKTLLIGDFSAVRLWDVATGKPLGPPLQHPNKHPNKVIDLISAVALSPDGKTVLTGGLDTTARLWDGQTGEALLAPLHHEGLGSVNAVAFSPDGKMVLTASGPGGISRLWETDTGKLVGQLRQNVPSGMAVAFSPDGKAVLTGDIHNTARLWETATAKPLTPPLKHKGRIWGVAFSPDGNMVLTGSNDGTRLWEVATGKCSLTLQHLGPFWVRFVAFSPDGKMVLTGADQGRYGESRLWDVVTGKPITGTDQGRYGESRLWDVVTGKPIGPPMKHQPEFAVLAFNQDGKTVLVLRSDGKVVLWEVPAPLSGEPSRITLWVQVETGMELDEQGAVRTLDAATREERRQRLAKLGGPPLP
jgi:WD40 repeat protein